jgi:flagella basal body P-ring formation protein FlgA
MTLRMKFALLVCFGAACACVANARTAAGAELQLRSEVHMHKPLVTLGDVAQIFSANSQEDGMLAAVELIPAPTAGTRQSISVREIQDILSMRGLNLTNLQFTGAAQVSIIGGGERAARSAGSRLVGSQLQRAKRTVVDAIVQHLRSEAGANEDWQVAVELDENQVAPIVAARESIQASGGTQPWTGRQTFTLEFPSPEGESRVEVSAEVSLPPAVVVALHMVQKGSILRADDVQLERLHRGTVVRALYQSLDDVVGKEAIRTIPEGQPIDASLAHAPMLVRSGEVVTVFARNSGIVIRMPARARENGSDGELVTVESLTDRQTFLARVSGLHEVEVFAGATTTAPATSSGRQTVSTAAAFN